MNRKFNVCVFESKRNFFTDHPFSSVFDFKFISKETPFYPSQDGTVITLIDTRF